jgi:uncharacterized protein YqgV (UPF0045/DUF77 family)
MNSIIETAKNIIATYSHREDCKAMVANAVRILKDKGVELYEENSTGTLYEVVRVLKASLEVRSLSAIITEDGYNVGHSKRKVRENEYGEFYMVGFKDELFTKVN